MNRSHLVHYSLSTLQGEGAAPCAVFYGRPEAAPASARVVIVPCGFFEDGVYGEPASLPSVPLAQIEGSPLLYGRPCVERRTGPDGADRLVVYADIVASAFFLLTRYEEIIRRSVRDEHGRFRGRESLPFRAGFLHRPIVDEYAALLRGWLRKTGNRVAEPPVEIEKIYLTHDVDLPWMWSSFPFVARATLRRLLINRSAVLDPILSYWGLRTGKDPYDCFDWISEQDMALRDALGDQRVECVFLFLAGGEDPQDGRDYLNDRRTRMLISRIKSRRAALGLHSSYSAGIDPGRVSAENARLGSVVGGRCHMNLHHYLASREPEHMAFLEPAGITDDFTMGYADVTGFRLGTCRPVRWFDPVSMRSTGLTLHPLTIMEVTLERPEYMGLDFEQARGVCHALLNEVAKHHGEAVLLWHNNELSELAKAGGSYQRGLYSDLLTRLNGLA